MKDAEHNSTSSLDIDITLIIERLDLIAFGNFTDLSIDLSAGPKRLHLVYGPNESGKSTSLRAITSWLFGMPHTTTDDYLHPMAKIRVGGRLTERDGNVLECVRRRGRRGTLRDADDSIEIDELVLSRMLGGIDKSAFETRFGISHAELLQGGEQILSGEGEVGEILFAAGAGIGQLQEIASKLSDEVGALFKTRGNSTVNDLIKDVENQRRELREAQFPPAEFDELQTQIRETQESIERIKAHSSQLAMRLGRLQAAVQALPLIPRWQAASEAFAKVASAPCLPTNFPDRRRQWDQGRQLAIAKHQELARRHESLTQQLTKLSDDPLVRMHELEIEEVYRQLATREKANKDAQNLTELARREKDKVVDILAKLSDSGKSNDTRDLPARVDAVRFSDSARDKVRRLASQFEKLVQQRDDAKLDIERHQRQLTTTDVKSLSFEKVDPDVLTRVLDEVGLPQRLIESAKTVGEEYERWIRRCEETRDKLGVTDCFRKVALWRLPSTDVIANAKSRFDSLEDSQIAARLRCEQTQEIILEKQDRLHQLTSSRSLPTIQDLSSARRDRDLFIESIAHTDDLDAMLVRLRDTVANADQIADEIQTHYGTVHQIELENANILSLTRQLDREQAKLAEQEAKSREAAQAWARRWSEFGVQPGSPSAMAAWIADHDRLCEFVETLEATEREKTATTRRIENGCFRLQSVLGGMTDTLFPEAADEADLAQRLHRLYDETMTLRNRVLDNRKDMESKTRQHEQLKHDLEHATEQLARCQQALDAWHVEWSTSTAKLSQQKSLATDTVLDMLDWIKDLEHFLHEYNVLEKRKRSISEEFEAYKRQVVRLANNANQGSVDSASTPDGVAIENMTLETLSSIVTSLYQRSNRERSIRESRANIASLLKKCEEEIRAVDENMLRLDVVARQLCEEAGCESTDDLVQLETRSLLRREASAELNEYASKLEFFVGDSSIDEYAVSMSEVQTETLQVEIQCIESEKAAVDEQLAELQQKLGAFRHRRDLIDGGNRAADLAQSLQLNLGHLQRECQTYLRLKLAGSVLQQAIEHYRSNNQGPVLEAAESYFTRLTCGEYSSLKVDYDTKGVPLLQGLRGDLAVPAPMMSTGTADALYLALRLASLKHQMGHNKAIPLVIDDCLIQLDDRRAVAALEVFSELSTTTQVILFTHHEHLLDLAQSNLNEGDFHVHRLDQLQAAV